MSEKCSRRELKRHETALRLQRCAVRLTLDKGFDGWTMGDLAEASDVSRRTVFNYFESKADVVLGPVPELTPERVAVFTAGGPSGNLLDDVLILVADLLEEHGTDQESIAAGRSAVLGDHRLLALVHERFEVITATFVEHVRAREGEDFSVAKARLLGRLVATVFDSAIERVEADATSTFTDHFTTAITDARAIFG